MPDYQNNLHKIEMLPQAVLLVDFIIGTFSASIVKTALLPFNNKMMTKLTQTASVEGFSNIKSLIHYQTLINHTYKPSKITIRPFNGLVFAFKDFLRCAQNKSVAKDGWLMFTISNFYCGGMAAFLTSAFLYPLDYRKVMIAGGEAKHINYGTSKFQGPKAFYRHRIYSQGVFPLFKGCGILTLGAVVHKSLFFGIFDTFKVLFPNFPSSLICHFGLGLISSATALVLSFPFDVVRKRQIADKLFNSSPVDVFNQIVRQNNGYKGLFKGVGNLMYRSLAGALTLTLYEQLQVGYYTQMFLDRQKKKTMISH